jgi:hypothetical protein
MTVKKSLLILFGIFLFALILGVGAGIYYYTHPSEVKALIEKTVSRTTGGSFSIQHLGYSLNPIRINAKGISFEPAGGGNGFSAEVRDFAADGFLSGPFGRKILHFKTVRINGFECRVREGANAVSKNDGSNKNEGPSFVNSMAKALVSFFLFKDFRIDSGEIGQGLVIAQWSGGRIQVSSLSGHLNNDHLVDIRGGILMDMPGENRNISIPNFHLETTNTISLTDPKIDFTFSFPDGDFRSSEAKVDNIQSDATLYYNHLKQKITITHINLTLKKIRLKKLPQTENSPLHISFNAAGDIDLGKRKAIFNGLSLRVKKLLQFNGTLDANFGHRPNFKLTISKGLGFTQQLVSMLPKGLRGKSSDFNISGPVDFSGTFRGMVNQGQWALDCDAEGNMESNPVSYRTPKIHMNGLMTAQIALHGPISNLKLSGSLTGNQMAFQEKHLSIKAALGTLNFSGTYPYFEIRNLSCRIPEITHLAEKKAFSVEHMVIGSTKGRINLADQSLNFPEIRLKSSLLSNIRAALQINGHGLTLTAKAKEAGLIRAASALKLLPSHWTFQGMDTMEFEAAMDRKGAISFSAGLTLDKFDFLNPQETYLGENISLHTHISGRMTPPQSTIKAVVVMDADGGEVLMDRFYFDLKENPFSAQCNGTYQGLKKLLKLDNLSLGMKKIAMAHVTGTLFQTGDEYEGDLSITIPDTPLKSPFHRLIREPFQTEKPALSKIRLDGIIGGEISLKGKSSHWMTKGVFIWKDGSMFYGDSLYALTGIHLSLPIRLTNVKGREAAQNLEGGLSVRSMKLPFLPEQELKIPIQAESNGLFMPAITTLAVPGGTIRVGPSRIIGLMGPTPIIQSALHFKNLQLEPILKGLWPHPVKGSANGNLDPIHVEWGQLQSKGEIKATIFNGALTLSHVGARGLFTALPVYSLNARWHHLNLAEMTEGTSFGKIEGILNGYAKKIEVSNGQLQRFDLLLDTVKTDDAPQKISVKAVDNIARLGGGQSPFAGMAGIFVSFFKEFPYEKIGVHATLENDVFRIRGTIREDDREYLVKRGFFSGVDVINQSKDNRVGFKDMLKRIKRITHSKGGPIVK